MPSDSLVERTLSRSSHTILRQEMDIRGLSGQLAMIHRAWDRPPPWARSTSHETEQMLCQSTNHWWASRKRWHHRQIRANAVSFLVVVSACASTERYYCTQALLAEKFNIWEHTRFKILKSFQCYYHLFCLLLLRLTKLEEIFQCIIECNHFENNINVTLCVTFLFVVFDILTS